jgi:hypothetical protein
MIANRHIPAATNQHTTTEERMEGGGGQFLLGPTTDLMLLASVTCQDNGKNMVAKGENFLKRSKCLVILAYVVFVQKKERESERERPRSTLNHPNTSKFVG